MDVRAISVTMAVAALVGAGCARGLTENQERTLGGAAVGAGTGALIGEVAGDEPGTGAAIGGAAGAVGGSLLDDDED